MRQLERLMGADAFRDGLRDYLKEPSVRQRNVARFCGDARKPHKG